jgi:hypothetical protein
MAAKELYTPTDIDRLRMENDLLALQAQVHRSREREHHEIVAGLQAECARLQDEVAHLRGVIAEERSALAAKAVLERDRYEELRTAHRDLIWLLRRLSKPPLGWVMTRRGGFRKLMKRWREESRAE